MSLRTEEQKKKCPVVPLGFEGMDMVYFAKKTGQVHKLSPSQHKAEYFKAIASDSSWRNWHGSGSSIYSDIADSLQEACRRKGLFDIGCVRGIGVWKHGEQIIYNAGSYLFVDGKRYTRCEFEKSCMPKLRYSHVYTNSGVATIPAEKQASTDEILEYLEMQKLWNWVDDNAPQLIIGAQACAYICPSIPWRPMVLINAMKGAGKTTHAEITYNVIGDLALYKVGGTTEAGLRQEMSKNGDGRPILYDEFEKTEKHNLQDIIGLMRVSAAPANSEITKGTPGQRSITQRLASSGTFYGINTAIENPQDRSRWVQLKMDQPEKSVERVRQVLEAKKKFDTRFGEKFLTRMLLGYHRFHENYDIFKNAILLAGHDARAGDLYGVILAGWYTAISDTVIEYGHAVKEIEFLNALDTGIEEAQANVLNHLKSYRLKIQEPDGSSYEQNIASWLFALHSDEYKGVQRECIEKNLANLGIRIIEEKLYIASNSKTGIERIFKGTEWDGGGHREPLRQLGGQTIDSPKNFAGVSSKAYTFPMNDIIEGSD